MSHDSPTFLRSDPATGWQIARGGKAKTRENRPLQPKPGRVKTAVMKRMGSSAVGSRWPIIPEWEDRQVCLITCWHDPSSVFPGIMYRRPVSRVPLWRLLDVAARSSPIHDGHLISVSPSARWALRHLSIHQIRHHLPHHSQNLDLFGISGGLLPTIDWEFIDPRITGLHQLWALSCCTTLVAKGLATIESSADGARIREFLLIAPKGRPILPKFSDD